MSVKSPGRGVQPNRRNELIGRAIRAVAAGDFFYPSDLDASYVDARPYSFRRPWGLPVRYHDLDAIVAKAAPDFVEFHFSYQDMEIDPATYIPEPLELRLRRAQPGPVPRRPHLEPGQRRRRVVAPLDRRAQPGARPHPRHAAAVPVHRGPGGHREPRRVQQPTVPMALTERAARYERVIEGIGLLDRTGVELVAQTLPPFPWYLGGQLHCNLFVDPADTAASPATRGLGLCLDVSHSKLACNHRGTSFAEFVEQLGPYVHHLHLVDAEGSDGEGLQVGDGDIDWPVLAAQLDRLAPGVGFIPEIWQGHKNDGEGFWIALDRLEEWF